ncbi:MAG: DUF4194 domain-containing protein [Candidatus Obscuribacterales bacterium]|nr:DUF4194 domain-containing protein [Candidatus Obscuribacterales bacterium]
MNELDSISSATGLKENCELSSLMIALLKGVIYKESDEHLWNALVQMQVKARDYAAVLNLELVLDESEGYAFFRSSIDQSESDTTRRPRLMVRRQLSFPLSLLLALLRKKLVEFDARGGDTQLVLSREEIVDLVKVFHPDGTNETRIFKQVDAQINKVIELGFLRELKTSLAKEKLFEVRRILKAFVDAQWLSSFDEKMAQYKDRLMRDNGVFEDD